MGNNMKDSHGYHMDRRTFLKLTGLTAGALALSNSKLVGHARALIPQTPLPGNKIPQFVDELPNLHTITAGSGQIELQMTEFEAEVLPTGTFTLGVAPKTTVWGYIELGQPTIPPDIPSYIGPVIVATRDTPTEIKWVNNLGYADPILDTGSKIVAYTQSTDQTLHWADPLNTGMNNAHYVGHIPAVPHLHGGEVPADLDGGPDAWFTSDGAHQGHAYYSKAGALGNEAIYCYPNSQEAANIWFHDHTLGATRLGVYAGLAGAYIITDPLDTALPTNLPGPTDIIPLVIQDRMFDINGQLFFPNVGINPEHPFWIPEFIGDTIVVNGKVWPYKNVDRKRYRFLFLNGSNARAYEMDLIDKITGIKGPRMWVIGTDGGYLDTPVLIDPNSTNTAIPKKLTIMPGERYDVIIDFSGVPANTNLILRNTARTPFPDGGAAKQNTTGRIMQFRVSANMPADASYDPDPVVIGGGTALRTQIERLPGTPLGPVIDKTPNTGNVQKVRQLTLNEVMGKGGPLEVLVNNSKWNGKRPDGNPIPGSVEKAADTWYTEMPVEGETEMWEIINLTADAHPIHLHLVQFQLVNRQVFDIGGYTATYDAAFPGDQFAVPAIPPGAFMAAYGPPLHYETGNPDALGGNPDVTPFLVNRKKATVPVPPLPYEAGWKDTVIMYPGEVTRIMVRYAPTDLPAGTASTDSAAAFPFSPNGGHGYVWHCHIIDHEDNEMMRPKSVTDNTAATRTYNKGTHY